MFDLTGRSALVTGSSRGIGRAIAGALAASGADVVISSRKLAPCEAAAEEINAAKGGRAFPIAASIGVKADLERLVATATEAMGKIDVLVCNAAANPYYGPLSGISDEQFQKVLQSNILANHWLVQMVAPGMIARGGGSIILVSSIGAFRGSATIGAYNVSKAADIQLARNLAVELGPRDVRVNCIAPGLIRTDFSRALWEKPDDLARALADVPLGRIGEPADIAGAAVFLASGAARYITGETIVIDGGATVSSGVF